MQRDGVTSHAGFARQPGGVAARATVELDEATFALVGEGSQPRVVAYRDLSTVAISGGVGLLVIGDGPGAERWLLEQFGAAIGPLLAELRERRLRQRLADGLVELPAGEPVELVEYAVGREAGVAQLALDAWGVTLTPLDERQPVHRTRRAEITSVDVRPEVGGVRVGALGGGFDLLRLGSAATRYHDRLAALPTGAALDAGRLVAALVLDAPPAVAARAAGALIDGRPASPADLGDAWPWLEANVLREPAFAASYAALRARAGGDSGLRWLALAPVEPGADEMKAWFLVALPANLVALELVSEGAHATYCFRVVPRATYAGGIDPGAARAAVSGISAALLDARFLREPIAMPDAQLATPRGIRWRLALRALPSLALARAQFVGRLVHRDEASWEAALDDLITWHETCRDDGAAWPGRVAEEAMIESNDGAAAGGAAAVDTTASDATAVDTTASDATAGDATASDASAAPFVASPSGSAPPATSAGSRPPTP